MEDEEYERDLKNYEMSVNWAMKDIMSYFGEYIRDERFAMIVVRMVERRIGRSSRYSHLMLEFREILNERGFNIPFSLGYRRVK